MDQCTLSEFSAACMVSFDYTSILTHLSAFMEFLHSLRGGMLKLVSDCGVKGVVGHSSAEESEVTHSFTDSDKLLIYSSSDAEELWGGEGGHTYFSNTSPPCVSSVSLSSGRSAGMKHEPPFSSDKTKAKTRSSCLVLSECVFYSYNTCCIPNKYCVCYRKTQSDAVMKPSFCYHPEGNYFLTTAVFYFSYTTTIGKNHKTLREPNQDSCWKRTLRSFLIIHHNFLLMSSAFVNTHCGRIWLLYWVFLPSCSFTQQSSPTIISVQTMCVVFPVLSVIHKHISIPLCRCHCCAVGVFFSFYISWLNNKTYLGRSLQIFYFLSWVHPEPCYCWRTRTENSSIIKN